MTNMLEYDFVEAGDVPSPIAAFNLELYCSCHIVLEIDVSKFFFTSFKCQLLF